MRVLSVTNTFRINKKLFCVQFFKKICKFIGENISLNHCEEIFQR